VVIDSRRGGDPFDFWTGFRLTLFDADGNEAASSVVERFDASSGTFQLRSPLNVEPAVGLTYELECGLPAPVVGVRYLLGLPLSVTVPPIRLRLGTTRGTNALLTRTGARTALVTTLGFGDLLEIGSQERPDLFALTVRKAPP